MVERVLIRVAPEDVGLLGVSSIARKLSNGVYEFECRKGDRLFRRVEEEHRKRLKDDDLLVLTWEIYRDYDPGAVASSSVLCLRPEYGIMYARSQEAGVRYLEADGCSFCGYGARQLEPLRLVSKALGNVDFFRTRGGEMVVSTRMKRLLEDVVGDAGGIRFAPVFGEKGAPVASHVQLIVENVGARIVSPTEFGDSPFVRTDEEGLACPKGHTAGFSILSELHVDVAPVPPPVFRAEPGYGWRQGVFRPYYPLLLYGDIGESLLDARLQGVLVELVHITGTPFEIRRTPGLPLEFWQ